MDDSTLLDTINNIRSATGRRVINPILAAAIQSNTSVAVDGEQQRAAQQQAAADEKTTIMIKGGKASVKNMSMDDFMSAADDSGSLKMKQVQQLLQPASEAAKVHATVKSYGINTPDPNDPKLLSGEATSGYRGMYRASREIGNDPIISAVYGLLGKTHVLDPKAQAEDLQTSRAERDIQISNKLVKPQQAESAAQDRQGRLDFASFTQPGVMGTMGDTEDEAIERLKTAVPLSKERELQARSFYQRDKKKADAQKGTAADKSQREFYGAIDSRIKGLKTDDLDGYTKKNVDEFLQNEDAAIFDQTGKHIPQGKLIQMRTRAQGLLDDRARKEAVDARKSSQQNEGDQEASDIAGAIMRGEQPPDLSRMYGKGVKVRAELARSGYNLVRAQEDWSASQKYLATLNSPAQVRIRQATDNAIGTLDVVENLAKEWKAGGFSLLNKARLATAKSGALGQKAQSIATRLDAEINDLSSELGNVYMGGNSPTDHALSLAKSNLDTNWSEQTLLDNIKQTRGNLSIRRNSLTTAGVGGASANNPYAPPTQGQGQVLHWNTKTKSWE